MPRTAPRPPESDREPPRCGRDGEPMTLVRSVPRLGALPELASYRCARCGHVETIEVP